MQIDERGAAVTLLSHLTPPRAILVRIAPDRIETVVCKTQNSKEQDLLLLQEFYNSVKIRNAAGNLMNVILAGTLSPPI